MRENIGFTMALIGVAGLAEGQIAIPLALILVGAYLMRGKDEKSNKRRDSDTVRPYFLP